MPEVDRIGGAGRDRRCISLRCLASVLMALLAGGCRTRPFDVGAAVDGCVGLGGPVTDVTIPELQSPADPSRPLAEQASPWDGKSVAITLATDAGVLVVTGVFPTGYSVCDTGAPLVPGATSATDSGGYNNLYVDTATAPPPWIVRGEVLAHLSGQFHFQCGYSMLCATQQDDLLQTAPIPAPVALDKTDPGDTDRLGRLQDALVSYTGAVCPMASTMSLWLDYNAFLVESGGGACDGFSNYTVVLPSKDFGAFDPAKMVGMGPTQQPAEYVFTGLLGGGCGSNPACDGDAPLVACATDEDCLAAAGDPQYAAYAGCQAGLSQSHCVQAVCRKGDYAFWGIDPRTPDDIALVK